MDRCTFSKSMLCFFAVAHVSCSGTVDWRQKPSNLLAARLPKWYDFSLSILPCTLAYLYWRSWLVCNASACFNGDGSLIATTSRDGNIRIIDPRAGSVVCQGNGHDGRTTQEATWCSSGRIEGQEVLATTGCAAAGYRQVCLWDPVSCFSEVHLLGNLTSTTHWWDATFANVLYCIVLLY